MDDFEYSKHAFNMMIEREIDENWIYEATSFPDFTELISDKELHNKK